MDASCSPPGNFVEVTCAHDGQFDDGCWGDLGMGSGASAVNLESNSCSENGNHCFSHFSGMGMVHQQFLRILGMTGEHQRPDANNHVQAQTENMNISPRLEDSRKISWLSASEKLRKFVSGPHYTRANTRSIYQWD